MTNQIRFRRFSLKIDAGSHESESADPNRRAAISAPHRLFKANEISTSNGNKSDSFSGNPSGISDK